MEQKRCDWAVGELDIEYHDTVWGRPEHDDQTLFEMLILEGMQAGLSWSTILKKREGMRVAFDQFDPHVIIHYTPEKVEELLQNPEIIRNRLKVNSLIQNAKSFLQVQQEFGSFDAYLWGFVNNIPIENAWEDISQVPASTPLSDLISKDMKKRGFKFIGTTIIYAYMQAIGMVNDHLCTCDFYHLS